MLLTVCLTDDSQKLRKAVDYLCVFFLNDSKMAIITAITATTFQRTLSCCLEVQYFSDQQLPGWNNTQVLIAMKIMMVCAIIVLNASIMEEEQWIVC